GSTRNPRTLTWSSARPANSSTPSGLHRARSPVRYIRPPGTPNGHATNRSALSPGWFTYPRASPAPAVYSSPPTPTGTGSRNPSSTYTVVSATGRPIGTPAPPSRSSGPTGWVAVNVVFSVGPYPLTSRTCGTCSSTARQAASGSTSPPASRNRNPANTLTSAAAIWPKRPAVSHSTL